MNIVASLQISQNPEWPTPQYVFDTLDAEFHFTLDVCANADNHKCERYFDIAQDGLKQDWEGEVCWMNPPYGKPISQWVRKAANVAKPGGGTIVVGLLPNRTDTKWFLDVMKASEIRIVHGRLAFGDGSGTAPFGSIIAVWGTPHTPKVSVVSYKEGPKTVDWTRWIGNDLQMEE